MLKNLHVSVLDHSPNRNLNHTFTTLNENYLLNEAVFQITKKL